MARLIAASVTVAVLLALLIAPGRGRVGYGHAVDQEPAKGPGRAQADFKAAGVCARCHVVSVLEWSISKHVAANTTCQKCHRPRKEQEANERNESKPDRQPRR